jgi:uncharacterized protein
MLPHYDKKSRICISDVPTFPPEEELKQRSWDSNDFVQIQEWKTCFVRFYDRTGAAAFDKAPCIVREFDGFYEVNFKNYTGLTRIGGINLKVENRKISDDLYESMLSYISDKYASLVFSFGSATGLEHEKTSLGDESEYIKYLFLKKRLLDSRPNIDEIASLILSEPHKKLLTEERACMVDESDTIDSSLLVNMFSGHLNFAVLAEGHPLAATALGRILKQATGKRLYPAEARKVKKYYTFDTNENRFVLYFLMKIDQTIDNFLQKLGGKSGTYLNPDIIKYCTTLQNKINYLLADPLWNDVGQMTFVPSHSTVLQKRDGYRHLYHLYSLLQLATRYRFLSEDFRNIIENKDVATLFEYWSFFLVKDVLDSKYRPLQYTVLVPPNDIEHSLKEGVCIKYNNNFSLIYNYSAAGSRGVDLSQQFPTVYKANNSYSHSLRPDIAVVKNNGSKLIFDAKHKGKEGAGGFYGEDSDGTIEGYKEEDLDKMHTYREAIENVRGAFALYPGRKIAVYPCHNAQGVFHGIGALPLRPIAGGKADPKHYEYLTTVIDDFIKH